MAAGAAALHGCLQGDHIPALAGFNIDNVVATKALKDAKTRHARRWQTKEGTYRIKNMVPPHVRDTGDVVMVDTAAYRS